VSRERRARQERHDRERGSEQAYRIVVAELMAIDEPLDRQFLRPDDSSLALVADDVLWHWQADVGRDGYRDGLRGFIADYVRRVDGHHDHGQLGAVWAGHVAGLRDTEPPGSAFEAAR
jgi:hypothetical protein